VIVVASIVAMVGSLEFTAFPDAVEALRELRAQGLRLVVDVPDDLPELIAETDGGLAHKMTFDACRTAGFIDRLGDRPDLVVAGCETHVCVLQTVLGLLGAGRRVYLVRDAVGSRRAESKETAILRMAHHGAEIVTTEMAVFEWLGTADRPRLHDAIALIK